MLCVGETRWGSCAQGVVPVDIEKREEYPKFIFVYLSWVHIVSGSCPRILLSHLIGVPCVSLHLHIEQNRGGTVG